MKRIITICAAILMTTIVFAQSPEKMSYQAVVRNSNNELVTSTAVGMQISILQGTSSGTSVYVETQTPTSDANGLVSLEIGSGTVVSGAFTTIDWANGPYFIKTETDPTGGTSYTITGTSQLLSVPYALHSKTTDSIVGGDLTGNTELSFTKETTISSSFIALDTVNVKSGRVVTIQGYINSTGSACNVYLNDINNNNVSARSFIDDQSAGYLTYQSSSILTPWSPTSKEFTSYFIPTNDFQLVISAKELTATAGDGVCNVSIIVIQ